MRFRQINTRLGALRPAALAAVVAAVVALTGFEASAHGHPRAVDGWHAADCREDMAGDEGLNTCSICRLAHETSSAPVAPVTVSAPLTLPTPRIQAPATFTPAAPAREHSPRAPPSLASC